MRTYSTSEQRRPPAQAAEALRVAPIGWQRDVREFIHGLLTAGAIGRFAVDGTRGRFFRVG